MCPSPCGEDRRGFIKDTLCPPALTKFLCLEDLSQAVTSNPLSDNSAIFSLEKQTHDLKVSSGRSEMASFTELARGIQHRLNQHQSHHVAYQEPPSFGLLESVPVNNSIGQGKRVSLRPPCPVGVANSPELRSHSCQKWIQGIRLNTAAEEILGIFIPRKPDLGKPSSPAPTAILCTSSPGPFANRKVLSASLPSSEHIQH